MQVVSCKNKGNGELIPNQRNILVDFLSQKKSKIPQEKLTGLTTVHQSNKLLLEEKNKDFKEASECLVIYTFTYI